MNQAIPMNDEQDQDDCILIVVRMNGGVPEVMTPVGNEVMLKLVVIDDDDEENMLTKDYLDQFNLTHVREMKLRSEI